MKLHEENETEFYIGRSQKDNAELFKRRSANDYWFHMKELPGCHLYIQEKDLNRENIIIAANLVKTYSKIFNKATVCYTQKKNLKGTRVPGLLIIRNESLMKNIRL
jgi:predicted ribosome quality control (RQC) complex YloA/Tae2 family protein